MKVTPFRKQFLFTRNKIKKTAECLNWDKVNISKFTLLTHPDLEVTYEKHHSFEIYLLGFLLDWQNTNLSNQEILKNLLKESSNIKDLIENTFDFFGQYVIIIKKGEEIYLCNDAAGTKSIFYTKDFSTFGSTPKLLSTIVDVKLDTSKEAIDFYSSNKFLSKKKKYYIGNVTQYQNIKILLANHSLNIIEKDINRYFPNSILSGVESKVAAKEINKRLDGHIRALLNRYDCEMHVSAGLDSRILIAFGIKYNIPFVNYCAKPKFNLTYYDTAIPRKILDDYGRDLHIIEYDMNSKINEKKTDVLKHSVDFPRISLSVQNYIFNVLGSRKDKFIINGHGGEFGRNSLGVFNYSLSSSDIAQIAGYRKSTYAKKVYDKWLQYAKPLERKFNYSLTENFYWEQRFSIWSSKGVIERNLVGDFYAFFNNRIIFELMLSTPKKDRDPVTHKLFLEIIKQLDPQLLNYPFNPNRKNFAKNIRSKLGLENIWNELKFRLRKYK